MALPRLPDIRLDDWLEDQQKRFREATEPLFSALEFEVGARDAEAQIPPDYDALGGMDQWEQAEREMLERQYRLQQQEDEERRQREIEQQAEQYRLQQQEAEAARAAEQSSLEQATTSMIRELGIPTPSEAFEMFKNPGSDPTSTTGVFDVSAPTPMSPVEQFNQFASGMESEVFGPSESPAPDNESTTGLLDQIGSGVRGAVSSVLGPSLQERVESEDTSPETSALRRMDEMYSGLGQGPRWLVENVGAGKMERDFERERQLETEAGVTPPTDAGRFAAEIGDPLSRFPEAWRQANPEKVAELEEIRRSRDDLAMGASGGLGMGRGIADDAVNAIKLLLKSGLDEAALAAERNLAQKSSMTFEEIQRLTRGLEVPNPAPLTEEEQALNAAADARAAVQPPHAGYIEEAASDVGDEAIEAGGIARVGNALPPLPDDHIRIVHVTRNSEQGEQIARSGLRYPETGIENTAISFERAEDVSSAPWRGSSHGEGGGVAVVIDVPKREYYSQHYGFGQQGYVPDIEIGAVRPNRPGLLPPERVVGVMPLDELDRISVGRRVSVGTTPSTPHSPSQAGREVAREYLDEGLRAGEGKPFLGPERRQRAAELLQEDPEVVGPLLERGIKMDKRAAAVEQELLEQNARTWDEALDVAYREHLDILDEIKQFERNNPEAEIPDDMLLQQLAAAQKQAIVEAEFKLAFGAKQRVVQAASQQMNVQRASRLSAAEIARSRRLEDVAGTAREAAQELDRLVKAGSDTVDEGALKPLQEMSTKLKSRRNRRELQEATSGSPSASPGGGGRGAGRGGRGEAGTPRSPRQPEGETIVERHGRLLREQGRFQNMLDDPANPLDDATRKQIQQQLDLVKTEIGESVTQIREEALNAARLKYEADQTRRSNYTEAELDRIVDETVGRRAVGRIRRQASDEVTGRADLKASAQLTRDVEKAITRKINDERRLQESIDRQIQRRIDGALAQERRAEVRAQVKEMAQEAQVWAKRIRQFPDRREGLQEELDVILGRMREHSNVGQRVADDLAERLQVRLDEDVYNRAFRQARQETDELNDAMIQEIQSRIDTVLQNPRAPGQLDQIERLWQDMENISVKGFQKASNRRQKLYEQNLLKSGLDAEQVDLGALKAMLKNVDPQKPETIKPLLAMISQPRLWDVFREIQYINMLSDPLTHAKNISSTALNAGLWLMVRNPLEFVGSLGQTRGQGEALRGFLGGAKEGLGLAAETMRHGVNPRRLERARTAGELRHVGGEALPRFLDERMGLGTAGRALGDLMHVVATRPLEAGDALLGHMAYEGAFRQNALRHADDLLRKKDPSINELIDPASRLNPREQLYNHILQNPWDFADEVIGPAGKIEDYTLFRGTGKNTIEESFRRIMGVKELPANPTAGDYAKSFFVDLIMPFYNVPVNFTKQGLGNVAAPIYNTGKLAGAVARGDRQQMGEQFAKAASGGLLLGIPLWMASEGNLTGPGPRDPAQRRMWLQTHKPQSWRMGKDAPWISYEGTPAAIPFGIAGGLFDALEMQKNDPMLTETERRLGAVGGAARGAYHGALSNTFFEGLQRNIDLLEGDMTGVNTLAQSLAQLASRYSPTPPTGFMNFLARMSDTVERDVGRAKKIGDIPEVTSNIIESRLPGARQRLPERRDAFGDVIENERSGILAAAPGYQGWAPGHGDPITEQLQRGHVGMPEAPREVTIGNGKIPLTIAEQQRFQEIWGREYRTLLEKHGAGQRSITDKDLEFMRSMAREQTQILLEREIGSEEVRRRWRTAPPEVVAP